MRDFVSLIIEGTGAPDANGADLKFRSCIWNKHILQNYEHFKLYHKASKKWKYISLKTGVVLFTKA